MKRADQRFRKAGQLCFANRSDKHVECFLTTINAQTHHNTLDTYIAEARDKSYVVLESFPQQPPSDTLAVCNLTTNPNDATQYVVSVPK